MLRHRSFRPTLMPDQSRLPTRLSVAVLLGLAALAAVKILIAARLPLLGDEAFYWLESRHPAAGYSDLPLMTGALVRLGTGVAGQGYLGVRLAFLALGAMLPWLVYRLAREMAGPRQALLAAGASALLPLAGTLGVLAVPDVPLVIFGLAGLICMIRAVEKAELRWWAAAGLFASLGFCTHYRFVALLAGPGLYLLLTRRGRAQWRGAGPWLALALALTGLAPILWFNVRHGFAGLEYQFVERHPWSWNWNGARYLLVQAVVVTPLMFAVSLKSLGDAIGDARGGSVAAGIGAWFSGTMLAGFGAAAFIADTDHMSAHWPLAGWVVMLPWLAGVLPRLSPRFMRWLVPASGLAGTLLLLAYLAVAIWPSRLWSLTNGKVFPDDFTGWREAAAEVRGLRAGANGGPELLVAGNFMLAAELAFETGGRQPVYSLDHPLNRAHGRGLQMRLWELGERSLMVRHAGERAMVVIEDSRLGIGDRPGWARRLCTLFDGLDLIAETSLFAGRRQFLAFTGRVRPEHRPLPPGPLASGDCDLPPYAYLVTPAPGSVIGGDGVDVYGWAVEDNQGVAGVSLLLDGKPVYTPHYGGIWPDVGRFLGDSRDPSHPRVAFFGHWSPDAVPAGRHELAVKVRTEDGNVRILEDRPVTIQATPSE